MRARGFSLIEVLLAVAITLVLGGAVATLVAAVARASLDQPRAADEQQRLRAAFDQISAWIGAAGQGLRGAGANDGWLVVPPLYPQRRGVGAPDLDTGAWGDRITILSGQDPPAAGLLAASIVDTASPLVADPTTCGPGLAACGLSVGERVLVADARATGEWFTVTRVAGHSVEHSPARLATTYNLSHEPTMTGLEVRALYYDSGRRQLRLSSPGSDLPLVDGVAMFSVTWFGDARPPNGPRPPPGEANCVTDAAGQPRLPTLARTSGSWAELSIPSLSDGPWCGVAPWRFDADLLRVRLVHLSIRLDASDISGGASPVGPSIRFAVAPPNLLRLR